MCPVNKDSAHPHTQVGRYADHIYSSPIRLSASGLGEKTASNTAAQTSQNRLKYLMKSSRLVDQSALYHRLFIYARTCPHGVRAFMITHSILRQTRASTSSKPWFCHSDSAFSSTLYAYTEKEHSSAKSQSSSTMLFQVSLLPRVSSTRTMSMPFLILSVISKSTWLASQVSPYVVSVACTPVAFRKASSRSAFWCPSCATVGLPRLWCHPDNATKRA